MSEAARVRPKQDLLTVEVEDYYHAGALQGIIPRGHWYRFEKRLEQNTLKALDLIERFQIRCTFFVRGWIADTLPHIVREIARRGHELGSNGYYHRPLIDMTPSEFREDLLRARDAIERASGARVLGHRFARRWFAPPALWALQILAEEGYAYDSSFVPLFLPFRWDAWRRFAYRHRFGERELWEFPISTCNILGWMIPISGGYSRQLPHGVMKRMVERWHRTADSPFVMYFHVWGLDPEQPRISAASPIARIRQYRNLDRMGGILEEYFKTYQFVGMAEYLGLSVGRDSVASSRTEPDVMVHATAADRSADDERPRTGLRRAPGQPARSDRTPVTIVVPCFNEELTVSYLSNTLQSLETALDSQYELRFIFVDDASTDGTAGALQKAFGSRPNCVILRHARNLGVAGAILTGIRHSKTDIVCSIDCDCSYDPHELEQMIPLLTEGVAMVTASPYHPSGKVMNAPAWRLTLSRMASLLYRCVLRQKLSTYTSCFRVYRKSAVGELRLTEGGFLGVAEMLGRLDLAGAKIVEYPATLYVRLLGRSKMKVLRAIAGHVRLLARLLAVRMLGRDVRGSGTLEKALIAPANVARVSPSAVTSHEERP